MSDLPKCPCCGEDDLRLVTYDLENGQLHYKAVCDSCGVEFHHEKFYGYNSVTNYFEKACPSKATEDVSEMHGIFRCRECGCTVEEEGVDFGTFNYCPDCGREVVKW